MIGIQRILNFSNTTSCKKSVNFQGGVDKPLFFLYHGIMKIISSLFVLFFWVLESFWIDWVLNNLYGFDMFALVYLIPLAFWAFFANLLSKTNLTEEIRYAIASTPLIFFLGATLYILF